MDEETSAVQHPARPVPEIALRKGISMALSIGKIFEGKKAENPKNFLVRNASASGVLTLMVQL